MSALIKTIAGEKVIELKNGLIVRGVDILNGNWNSVRIGMRLSLEDTGATLTDANITVGLCRGNTNVFGDATITHWAGFNITANFDDWPRSVAPIKYASQWCSVLAIGNSVTYANGAGELENSDVAYIFADGASVAAYFCDITANTPGVNHSLNIYRPTGSVANITQAAFDAAILKNAPGLAGYGYGAAQTLAINLGTYGQFDHVTIHWDKPTALYIHSLRVVLMG